MNNEIAVALNMEPDGVAYMIHEKTGLEDFAEKTLNTEKPGKLVLVIAICKKV